MRRRSFPFVLLLLPILICFILQSNALVSSSFIVSSSGMINYNPTPEDGWLHTDGIYIKDNASRTVAVRAIANFPWTYPYLSQVIDNAKNHGINFITLGFRPLEEATGPMVNFAFNFNTQASLMDDKINLIKEKGAYAILNYHHSSAGLYYDLGLTTPEAQASHVIDVWTPILNRYKNEPTLAGIRMLDEPHLGREGEQIFYQQVIGSLRAINPNLLWFAHIINILRLGTGYWHLNPWQTPDEVPYPNIIMDGGMWISPSNTEFDPGESDYAKADDIFNEVTTAMSNFRSKVGIPTGLTPGISEYYGSNNAREYLLLKLHRWMEQNRYILTLYPSDYQLSAGNYGQTVFEAVFPDTPYPYYW